VPLRQIKETSGFVAATEQEVRMRGGRADEVEGRNPPIELRVGAIRFAIAPYGIIL